MARILVADDDPDVRLFVATTLRLAGHEVETAANGEEAIRLYRRQPSDLLLLDIFMPVKEGIGTLLELRNEFPEVRVVTISGGGRTGMRDYLAQTQILGARQALPKPFDDRTLLHVVESVLQEGAGR